MFRARTWMFATLAAVGTLTLGGPASTVAADLEDGIGAALLVLEEAPKGLLPLGIDDATEFNIDFPSYEANSGLEKANQKWNRNDLDGTEKVAVLIDFRMLFPDVAAAQAYLDEAEETLSESVTGLTLQPDTPLVGDDVRHYAGTLEGSGLSAEAQNFLFREGPVVGKVYILGFGTTVSDGLPLARAAAARTAAWLAARPLGSPDASPEASLTTSSPEPSMVAASAEPAATTGPSYSAAPAGAELHQWAVAATASSQYGSDAWSANQATGTPDVVRYADDIHAWASFNSDGSVEWLELTFAQAVVPTAIQIIESYNPGAVILVEAFDEGGDTWVELWSGTDPSPPDAIATFGPDIAPVEFATDKLRITLGDIVPGWSEIDAVELVGTVP